VAEVDRATDRLFETVSALTDDDAALPSLLPGWTRGHVLSHVARNADALVNLLTWARTGTPMPAYASTAAREADIEAGAYRPIDQLLADLRASAGLFNEAVAAMPAQAWSALVQLRSGAEVPAATVPWHRLREVEVHHVDLAAAYRPEDWPAAFTQRLLHDAVTTIADRRDAPSMVLHATDLDRDHKLGKREGGPTVRGTSPALVAWLTGRDSGEGLTVSPDQPLATPPQWM
jgi:maleylpyruvate isomerase